MAVRSRRKYLSTPTYRGKPVRDVRMDNVRGFLIILVVIGHFLLPLYRTRFVTGLIYAIYIFHMPCFLMMSGYYAKSAYKDGRFRWGKVVQLLWLYFLYEAVVNVTEGMLDGFIPLFPDILHESGAPWYLLALSIYYLTIPLLQRFRGGRRSVITTIGLMLMVSFAKYWIHVDDFLALDRVLSFLPFFYIGYFGTQRALDRYLLSGLHRTFGWMSLFFALAVSFGTYDFLMKYHLVVYGADYPRYLPEMHGYLWALNLLWYGVAFIISIGLIGEMLPRRMSVLTDLGKNTLQVYFLHRPIRDLMQYFGFYDWINPHQKLQVIGLTVFSAVLAVVLGNRLFAAGFRRIRSAFDPLLEKYHAL